MATHPQQHNPGNEEQLPVALVPTTPAPLATDLVVVGATQPPQPPQPQPHHVRSDSSFSMDSFVMDVVTNNNSNAAMDPDLDARLTLSFSSSNTNANNNNTSQQQQQYETIDPPQLRIRADSGMSYDSNVQPPPVHPFFLLHGAGAGTGSGNEFDGHNSDGSIVFKPATATTINPDNNYNNFSNSPTKHVRQPTQPQQQQRLPTKGVAGSNTNNSNTNSTTSTGSSSHHLFRRRDRFPSFDSAGSSGSVIKKAMAPTMTTTTTTLRSTPAPDKILLPYHERRKLLQQRQKQQQQSQHQQSQHQQSQQYRDQTPPRPGLQPPYRTTSTSSGTSSILPQQQLPLSTDDMPLHASLSFSAVKTIQQPQHSTNHPHRMAHPNDGGYRSMSQTPTQQQQLPYNLQSSPMPSQNYTYPPATSEMAHHAVHPAASHINPSDHRRERTGQTMQQQSVPQFLYQQSLDYASRLDPPPEEQALQSTLLGLSPRLPSATTAPTLPGHQKASEPAAASNTNNYDVGADPYPTSSSFDSSVGLDHWVQSEVRYGNHANNTGRARSTSHTPRHKAPPTPPPPPPPSTKPPPLRPSVLVRQGSGGSISSLGSIDRSGRPETIRPKDDPGGGLFARLNPWASPPPPKETSNVGDFHSKNQAFLSKIERFNTLNSPSPRQMIQRVSANSMPRPSPLQHHRRLNSIENDDWSERFDESDEHSEGSESSHDRIATEQHKNGKDKHVRRTGDRTLQHTRALTRDADTSDDHPVNAVGMPNERTSLLPPSGISTNEYTDRLLRTDYGGYSDIGKSNDYLSNKQWDDNRSSRETNRQGSLTAYSKSDERIGHRDHSDKTKGDRTLHSSKSRRNKKKRRNRIKHKRRSSVDSDSSSFSSNEVSPFEQGYSTSHQWTQSDEDQYRNQAKRHGDEWGSSDKRESSIFPFLAWAESFFANLPLTIGAIALSIASLGVVWFKFAEENMDSCIPVHFHSAQCTFPEFPGCFYCDTTARMYKVAEYFHFSCSVFAGFLALSFIAKLIVARQVVLAELSSPTTASPAGLLCMTLDVVFAGRGWIGMVVVSSSSFLHLCLAIWFLYLAMAYHTMPEPSWFPSTSGLGVSAVKTYLYFPIAGHFLMAVSLSLTFVFFPISLVRVYYNRKISATVGWMQMSAPNVALYAVTIMAQPSFEEENPDINRFQRLHRLYYLPFMTFLFFLCMLGAMASVHSLIVRWHDFRKLPFSPAHAAFCAPSLSHCNAVQAFRAAVLSFSGLSSKSLYLRVLFIYWLIVLIVSTFTTMCISTWFLFSLPKWTHFDLDDEIEPPAPNETAMSLSHMVSSGETLLQPFVSPAILQANETGALVLTRDWRGEVRYARTRRVTALGFEPIMDDIEIDLEREFLLDWVGRNAPRPRHRTLSVPGMGFRYGIPYGSDNFGVYSGMNDANETLFPRRKSDRHSSRRGRSFTESPFHRRKQSEKDSHY